MVGAPRRNKRQLMIWGLACALVIVGLASWGLNWGRSQGDTTNWLYLQPDTSSRTGFLLGIGMWVGAGALCFLLLKLISQASDLLKALAAMWRPVVIVAAAGYLLFFNDQGRELGLSLLGEHYGLSTGFLFVALFYWAANTWHTARLGIDRGLNNGVLGAPPSRPSHLAKTRPGRRVVRGDERWLYWPPRLLGVCAHLFAAINLSWAAWNLPLGAWGDTDLSMGGFDVPRWALRWLAWSAPFAIAFATAFVWAEDSTHSTRSKQNASPEKLAIARWMGPAAIAGELVVFGGLAYLGFYRNHVPEGFLPGTISISLSAAAFLAFISWLRNLTPPLPADASAEDRAADDGRQRSQIQAFTIVLIALAFLVAVAVWTFPAWFGALGSMVVAYFAFGAILALVNAIELTVESVSGLTITKQWLGEWAATRALGACVVVFAIAFGLLNAWLHPFHPVRLCDGGDCVSPISPNQRPTVAVAARAWYAQAKAAYKGDGPVPMLIVATAGGGIRAAYWTATVLERLEDDFEKQGGVRPYLFAISGVSGGSVGAMDFEAALARRDENQCKASKEGDKGCPRATDFLKEDFLAPALASLVFQDAPSSFLPDFGQGDRGAALEKSFERASNDLLARPFLSFLRLAKPETSPDDQQASPWRPILLLNATHEETGNRIITGHVLIERNVFVDSLDALQMLGKDVRASTAAHNSARFTYVSPAGNLGRDQGSVIDGGYFENFGALSALELAHAATAALKDETPKVKLVILMISSDPDLDSNHMLVRINEVRGIEGAQKSSENAKKKCLMSVAEREPASATKSSKAQTTRSSANYFTVDPTGVENALVNEFVAPFQGLEKVREAHGNWAAAELALEVCAEFTAAEALTTENPVTRDDSGELSLTQTAATRATLGEPSQIQIAAVRDNSRDVSVDDTEPVDVKPNPDRPYFAHLAMCKDPKDNEPAPIQPPLGWVLSKWTQKHFGDLLETCGNEKQLPQLETALRGKGE